MVGLDDDIQGLIDLLEEDGCLASATSYCGADWIPTQSELLHEPFVISRASSSWMAELSKSTPAVIFEPRAAAESSFGSLSPATTPTTAASPTNAATKMSFQKMQCLKTKLCKFHMEDRCNKGEACSFAHSLKELREKPELTRTKICQKWLQDYWKSTQRYLCTICNVSLPAHPRSIALHNASDMHNARKDSALQRVERQAADKAQQDRALDMQIQLIESAAMKSAIAHANKDANPQSPVSVNTFPPVLTYKEAMAKIQPPPLSAVDKQAEMHRLESFITQKLNHRPPSGEAATSADRHETHSQLPPPPPPLMETYYGEEHEIPSLIQEEAGFSDPSNWTELTHETTSLPMWHYPKRNLFLWTKPSWLDKRKVPKKEKVEAAEEIKVESPETSESAQNEETENGAWKIIRDRATRPFAVQEGRPGAWEIVPEGEEVINRDAVYEKAKPVITNALDRLDDLLKSDDPRRKGERETITDLIMADDLERVDRYKRLSAAGEKKQGFKKRKGAGAG